MNHSKKLHTRIKIKSKVIQKIKKFLAIIKNGDLVLRTDGSITLCTVFTLYLYSGYNLTL